MGAAGATGPPPGGARACPQDCPLAWRTCPRPPAGAGDPQVPCGGRGVCVPLDGLCRCFRVRPCLQSPYCPAADCQAA